MLSAYILFFKDEQPKLKAAHPTLAPKEIVTLAAKNWKTVDPHQKEVS